jgi:hypothetical protein
MNLHTLTCTILAPRKRIMYRFAKLADMSTEVRL